ncbi:MAG: hypothetical protein R3Y23_04345 [Bacillota bacterium]
MKISLKKHNSADTEDEKSVVTKIDGRVAHPKKVARETSENNCECSRIKDRLAKEHAKKLTIWTIKITAITFLLSSCFSYLSEITTSYAPLAIAMLLLILLVVINIIFDAVAVAATSCDLAPILSLSARGVKGSKKAVILVKNAEKVNNICADVIGDICGIISGACTVAIVSSLAISGNTEDKLMYLTIAFSSVIAALTVGGKAVAKEIAVKNSKDLIMFVGRILSIFERRNTNEVR